MIDLIKTLSQYGFEKYISVNAIAFFDVHNSNDNWTLITMIGGRETVIRENIECFATRLLVKKCDKNVENH